MSLDTAARILLGDSQDDAKLKTKIRRLYDIANILCSLHLIQKVHLANSRKPAFLWLCRENSVAELIAQGKGLRWFDKPDADESVHNQKSHVGALCANEETTGAQANGKKQQLISPFVEGVRKADIHLHNEKTGYVIWKEAPLIGVLLISFLGLVVSRLNLPERFISFHRVQ